MWYGPRPTAMAFDPLDFSNLARTIAAGTTSEAAYRTAVGRLYYSLHLLARDRLGLTSTQLKKITKRMKKGGSHAAVIHEVTTRDMATGGQLDLLRVLRIEADYHLQPSSHQFASWGANYQNADLIATKILPRIQTLK